MQAVLEIRNLSKEFTGTVALSSVSLTIDPGEIHMLVGQNGSGKSTLIKTLAGYHVPERSGTIDISGAPLRFGLPQEPYRLGCRFVHQDLGLVESTTVLDNLFLGSKYPTRWGTVRPRTAAKVAAKMLERVDLRIDVHLKLAELSASQRTGVAIARALREDDEFAARLVVLDEPTATLPANEVNDLLDTVRSVSAQGVGVLYVTHHMDEVFRIGDRVTILRDGVAVHTGALQGLSEDMLVAHLTGAPGATPGEKPSPPEGPGTPLLTVEHLRTAVIRDVSIEVAPAEILGVAGITGSGREELLGAVFGARRCHGGDLQLDGRTVPRDRPDLAIAMGVSYLPADRNAEGSFPLLSAQHNLTVLNLRRFWRRLLMRNRDERQEALGWFTRLDIRPARATKNLFKSFSGGNQQKILLGKWLSSSPRLLLLDEPTQGVDVGAKREIHREILRVASEGAGVVVSSTDLEELTSLCGRVIVMANGAVERELIGDDVTVANLTRSFLTDDDGEGQAS